jgi:predicted nucleotidyltransferase
MNPFTADQERVLTELLEVWPAPQAVLVGASALSCYIDMRWRKTEDLDLTVSSTVDEYPTVLASLRGWRHDPRQEQRWYAPGDVRVDIVPAGRTPARTREITWPQSGMRMSLVGLKLAFENNESVPLRSGGEFPVATVPVVALLKMGAYCDRSAERGRDLADLAYILAEYAENDLDRRFSPDVLALRFDSEDVGAYLLGRDITGMVDKEERSLVDSFLEIATREDHPTATLVRLAQAGPRGLRDDLDAVLRRLRAFAQGFGRV